MKWKERIKVREMSDVKIDVLIPAYHPDMTFGQLLRALVSQKVPVNKVIIINTEREWWESRHMDQALPKELVTEVHHITKQEFDHGATRKMAASFSDADILLFMTQDAVPSNSMLTQHILEAFEDKKTAMVYARQLPAKGCRLIEQYTRSFNYPPESCIKTKEDLPKLGIKTYFASNVCAAYCRDVFWKLGGFIEKTIFNEDMIFAAHVIQAGYQIAYQADAKVIHSHNYSGMQYLRRNFDLGVSQADFPEIFDGLPSEGEGIRLVKKTAAFLMKNKKPWLLCSLVWTSGCKYVGYRLGKNYKKLPKAAVVWLSMNKNYWK